MTLFDEEEIFEVRAESGIEYQLEFQVFWDDPKAKTIRVLGSIDDGGIRAFFPLCESIIMASDGTLVGE